MSLLNSVLSSINPGGQAPPAKPASQSNGTSAKPNPAQRRDNGGLSASRPLSTSTSTSTNPLPPKRKAEDVGRDVSKKAPRVDSAATLVPSVARSATNSPAQRQGIAPPPKTAMPYRGTMGNSRPPPTTATAPATFTAPKSAPAVSSAPSTPVVAPKSGYLAALERAKAAQIAAKKVGQIQHKPVEKLTKKDRKPVDIGYKGTMRGAPAPLAYTGTMRPSGSAVRKPQPAPAKGGDRYRYASYSDDEEDDMSPQEDYETDSDMEAGMDEVDAEEEEAARIARREDAEALREENELKRVKLERKRRIEQLAAAAKKKNNNRY